MFEGDNPSFFDDGLKDQTAEGLNGPDEALEIKFGGIQ